MLGSFGFLSHNRFWVAHIISAVYVYYSTCHGGYVIGQQVSGHDPRPFFNMCCAKQIDFLYKMPTTAALK